ncbi:MAG TPA: zinc-dependent metalloprotease family protein [Pontiella sp.]
MKCRIKAIRFYAYSAFFLFGFSGRAAAQQAARPLAEIPSGIFKTQLESSPADIQTKVLEKVAALDIPDIDFASLRLHPRGEFCYVCDFDGLPPSGQAEDLPAASASFTSAVPISSPPVFHSRPGAPHVLFLDFNGAVVTNTAWNSYPTFAEPSWDCRPYALDGDDTTFSIAEQQAIRTIWERVAEDYAPFDIDVTTEEPATWNRYTGHVLITPELDKNGVACPHEGSGGVAFVDVFGAAEYSYDFAGECYSPAWVLNYEAPGTAEYEAEAAAHEMGHNLALSHDGTKKDAYYGGHENGSIGWGPIMGTGYSRDVSQWSKGDYRLSNNPQDDLAILAARITYRLDDFGDTDGTAAPLAVGLTGTVFQTGVVEMTDDTDVFEFNAYAGPVHLAVSPYRDTASTTWGGNLDAVLELYDGEGALVASNNPLLEATADLTASLSNGVYYLHVSSTGLGDPFGTPVPTGYTRYGSLGQYTLSGSVPVSPDLDNDGLPNEWEQLYFFSPTGAVALVDADGDGAGNLEEYISGHNPTNPASVFEISSVTGNVPYIVTWDSIKGRLYNVEWSTNLVDGVFTNISAALPYPANSYTDSVERIPPANFYRVEVQRAP